MADERDGPLDAGELSIWLEEIDGALRGERGSDVPCGACTACCTSSQFVHIEPDERATLARVPKALLFPAPRMPRGHVLLGFDEHGRCPMLVDERCSIYDDRPRTCRTYDCRVFPAAGIEPEGAQVPIAVRARRWRFAHDGPDAEADHDAVRAAAAHLAAHGPELGAPEDPTRRAVLAVTLRGAFLETDPATGRRRGREPDPVELRRMLRDRLGR